MTSFLMLVYFFGILIYQHVAFDKINARTSLTAKQAFKWKAFATASAITWPVTGPIELGLILHRKYKK